MNAISKSLLASGLVLGTLALASGPAAAVEYRLCVREITKDIDPGPAVQNVTMWGSFLDANMASPVCDTGPDPENTPNVPGPTLSLGPADDTLTVHLRNELPNNREPISLVVAGLNKAMTPTWIDPQNGHVEGTGSRPFGDNSSRVRSFDTEVPRNSEATFEWTNVTPGNYLYHSGTHPQVQVQMGLYGMVSKDEAAGSAYAGIPYDREIHLLFSEVDPDLHTAVDDGDYNTNAYPHPSTLDYNPRFFLINGEPRRPDCITGDPTPFAVNERLLIRMQNAGLREVAPMILGTHWDVVAEGGNPLPFPRNQHSVMLQPGSSKDVIFTPDHIGTYAILDRRMNLTNRSAPNGGAQWCIEVETDGQPVADAGGPYTDTVGSPIGFDGSGSTDDGTIVSYEWDFGDGNTASCPGDVACFGADNDHVTHAYASTGIYAVSLVVTDDDANDSAPDYTSATVNPADGAPVADAGGPYEGKTGFEMTFDGSGSTDDGAIVGYDWDFGDGKTASCPGDAACVDADQVTHTYASAAGSPYTVTLTVTDNTVPPVGPQSDTDTAMATVTDNTPPTALFAALAPSPSATVTLDGSGSTDCSPTPCTPEGDDLTYEWNFADGTSATCPGDTGCSAAMVEHTFPAPATYSVSLVVNDGYADSALFTRDVTILAPPGNDAPVANDDAFNPNQVAGNAMIAAPGVLFNDTDGDGDTLTAELVSQDEHLNGLVLSSVDGSFSYQPLQAVGVFPFTYQASDGSLLSNVATVNVTREIFVKKAEFKQNNGRWTINGTSSETSGTVTIYNGPTIGAPVLATAPIAPSGNWSFAGTAGGTPPAGTTISVDNTATTDDCPEAPKCGAVEGRSLNID